MTARERRGESTPTPLYRRGFAALAMTASGPASRLTSPDIVPTVPASIDALRTPGIAMLRCAGELLGSITHAV